MPLATLQLHSGIVIFRDVCLPIIVLIGAGWLLDRKFRLDLNSLIKLNLYLFVPAFIFVRVTNSELPGADGFRIVAFTLSMIATMGALSWAASALLRKDRSFRNSMQLTTMFYNCGNFGLPLMTLAFPDEGPVIQVFVLMTMNVTTFSLGLYMANTHHLKTDERWWDAFMPVMRQPSVYALILAWLFRGLEWPVQDWVYVWRPLLYLEEGLVAVALVTLGVQLSKTKAPSLRSPIRWSLGLRLLGGPTCAAVLAAAFGFQGEAANILIVGAAAPTAINVALLAHEFKADSQFAAAAVFYSTLFSVVVVTLLLMWMH